MNPAMSVASPRSMTRALAGNRGAAANAGDLVALHDDHAVRAQRAGRGIEQSRRLEHDRRRRRSMAASCATADPASAAATEAAMTFNTRGRIMRCLSSLMCSPLPQAADHRQTSPPSRPRIGPLTVADSLTYSFTGRSKCSGPITVAPGPITMRGCRDFGLSVSVRLAPRECRLRRASRCPHRCRHSPSRCRRRHVPRRA